MAVHWSWAFGAESGATLSGDMGWTVPVAGGTVTGDSGVTYTYAGSPTRYSMSVSSFRHIRTPSAVFVPEGWLAMPIYCATDWYKQATNGTIFEIVATSGKRIYAYQTSPSGTAPTGTIEVFVGSTSVGTFNLQVNTWYYLAVKYKIDDANWSVDVFVDGASVASGTSAEGSESTGTYGFGGFSYNGLAHVGQIIVYDWSGTGQEDAIFVTRCDSISDRAVTGTWTPSTGTDQYDVIDSPFSTATYTENTSASVGVYVECRSSPLSDASQLNLSGVTVRSVCTHDFSEGSGVSVKASICDSTACTSGAAVTPATGTTSYCFAVSDTQPSGGAWQTGSSVIVKHEVV